MHGFCMVRGRLAGLACLAGLLAAGFATATSPNHHQTRTYFGPPSAWAHAHQRPNIFYLWGHRLIWDGIYVPIPYVKVRPVPAEHWHHLNHNGFQHMHCGHAQCGHGPCKLGLHGLHGHCGAKGCGLLKLGCHKCAGHCAVEAPAIHAPVIEGTGPMIYEAAPEAVPGEVIIESAPVESATIQSAPVETAPHVSQKPGRASAVHTGRATASDQGFAPAPQAAPAKPTAIPAGGPQASVSNKDPYVLTQYPYPQPVTHPHLSNVMQPYNYPGHAYAEHEIAGHSHSAVGHGYGMGYRSAGAMGHGAATLGHAAGVVGFGAKALTDHRYIGVMGQQARATMLNGAYTMGNVAGVAAHGLGVVGDAGAIVGHAGTMVGEAGTNLGAAANADGGLRFGFKKIRLPGLGLLFGDDPHSQVHAAGLGEYNANLGTPLPGYWYPNTQNPQAHTGPLPAMNREDAVRYIEGFQYYPTHHIIRSPRDFFMFDEKYGLGRNGAGGLGRTTF